MRKDRIDRPAEAPGTNTVLVMASSLHTCTLIKDFLGALDGDAPRGTQGKRMMEDKLRLYLWWKGKLSERKTDGKGPIALPKGRDDHTPVSEAMKKKDEEKAKRAANRRRVRGGAPTPAPAAGRDHASKPATVDDVEIKQEADDIALLYVPHQLIHAGILIRAQIAYQRRAPNKWRKSYCLNSSCSPWTTTSMHITGF